MRGNSTSDQQAFEALSQEKRRLFELLLEQAGRDTQPIQPVPRTEGAERVLLPMSWAQQRLWFIDRLEEGGAAYNIPLALRLRGNLDRDALMTALDSVVQRHEVLRTTLVTTEDGPRQEIATCGRFPLLSVELDAGEAADPDRWVRRHKLEEGRQQFDLCTGPLIRGRLLRLRENEHVLLVTMHHIVSDGWSLGVFVAELRELYDAHRQRRTDSLTALPIQYADYAQWQRQWLQGPLLDRQVDYWRTHLNGAAPALELPADRPRSAVHSYRGGRVGIALDEQLSASLNAFARARGMTLFMVLYGAWAILLSRLSGQPDVVVGTPVANRRRPELEALIGFFVNTIVLRIEVTGETQLEEFFDRVKATALAAYDHQDMPFEQLVEILRPPRSLNRHPIFQVMFALQNAPSGEWTLPGLTVTLEDSVNDTAKFDLLLSLEERDGQIAGYLNYDVDLFDRSTAERWTACFETVLSDLVSEQRRRVGELQILPLSERNRLAELLNPAPVHYSQPKLIHQLFEEQVLRTPQAVAVVYEEQSLTYAELNGRANQLAHHLRGRGVAADQLVALYAERSLELVVGLIGILKAGAAYLPLDTSHPAERLQYTLEDAAPRVLLTLECLRERLPPITTEIIALDSEWQQIAASATTNLDASALGVRPHHLAYVIYTSGSTGKPKGVMVEHRNVTRLFAATEQWFHFDDRDVWTLFHSVAFDFSVWELWGALLYGGRVVVVPYLTTRSPEEFYRLLCRQGVTVLNQTPSAFVQLIEAQGQCADLRHALRVVIFGGEALELHTLLPWVERNGADRPQLVNMYGITETTVHVTYRPLSEQEIRFERGSLIGRPIPDLQVHVLDPSRQPVPIGVTGEMYVGGGGVARGYLNRPELTVQRFVPDPVGDDHEARLYRTGDLARWRADGTLEYLGRNDDQVKIRGFRIELGEIEAQLTRRGQVKDAVVIVREDVPGEKRLVAYVVPADIPGVAPPSADALRALLKTALPEYMVPAAFVTLPRLPLTSNGKLDRRALPAPQFDAYVSRRYEAPQGEIEEILAGIWQSLLRLGRVGRQDNFFELGGHSLLIVQMMERLRRVGLAADVRRVFESPTLADLASALTREALEQVAVPPNLIPSECKRITPAMLPLVDLGDEHIAQIVQAIPGGAANIQDIYPLAPLQEGILFHHLLNETGGDVYVLPVALSVSSRRRLDDLVAALQAVVDRHDVLRTAIVWRHLPRPVQVVWRHAKLLVEEVTLRSDREPIEQVKEWMRIEHQRLNLQQAPLLRLRVAADPGSEGWYALLQLHHIIDDATSMKMVIAETVAHLEGRAHELLESVPYRSHVAQSLAYARKHDAEEFFRCKLGDVDEPTAPFGLLNVRGDGTWIREAGEELEPDLARRVRSHAQRLAVSAATLFHAAWALVVARTSDRDDVVFGSVLLGRLQGTVGIQRTLGMFINTLPLRLRLQGITAKQLVELTQRELIELLSHEQASLSAAQRCSAIVGSAPLFTTLFNYRHAISGSQADWSGASGIRTLARRERTNYPITLSVDDLGEGFRLTALTDRHIDPSRIAAFLRTALQSLTEALDTAPQMPASDLCVLPQLEHAQITELFNATTTPYSEEKLIHQLFEEQAERTPDVVALVHGEHALTYADLNSGANCLARYLVRKGIRPGALVGVCVERSLEMVVGLLGILKTGAAYVPLDPNYPPERLRYMLTDASPALVLTQQSLRAALPDSTRAEMVDVATILHGVMTGDEQPNLPATTSGLNTDDLVYVIYTSGSTGQPKGTAMPHRSMVNLIEWHRQVFGSDQPARVLQFAALSFDVAFQETFSTLCTGGTLVLLDEAIRKDVRALLHLLDSQRIERLFLPPLMLQSLAEYARISGHVPPTLKDVITAGEQLRITPEIVDFFRRLEACRLHNHYGPTETHVVTALTLVGAPDEWPALPTIGRPIANTQIRILDRERRVVPIGVAGEIYIAGANLARGYLNRPELSAQRFIADASGQARAYRTGDLGSWRADGTIEYLGRNDDQVKIRGFRIELGEIECQLGSHPSVKEAAVVAREDVGGDRRLVAYVTRRDGCTSSADELRAHLKAALPEHMIPSAFVALDSLPVTPSGKLNRRALPAPELSAYATGKYEAPQGSVEQALAQIWCDVLGVNRIGRNDDFFELGGHSLLVLKALLKINAAMGCALTVTDIYRSPTICGLAHFVDGRIATEELVDLSREALLDENLVVSRGSRHAQPRAVLLTGASGFVGRFLLAQLLADTSAQIYCLVRARSNLEALSRLRATLLQWDLWQEEHEGRVIAIAGDLRKPRLGIDASAYQMLAERVDSIYHCATSMNHLETYAMAKAATVGAARELLQLATQRRPKLINHISTLGIFTPRGDETARLINEASPIERELHAASSGYVASKWVAEKVFMLAGERGIACNIFRLGFIWADSRQGRYDELQRDYRVIKSCLLLGCGIENHRYLLPPTPVDHAARAVVFLGERHADGKGIFHVSSPAQMNDGLFERCNEVIGTDLDLMPYYDWICEIKRLHYSGRSLPVVPLIEYAFSMDEAAFNERQRRIRAGGVRFDCSRTQHELDRAGIVAPVLDDELVKMCVEGMLARDPDLRQRSDDADHPSARHRRRDRYEAGARPT